MPQLIIYLLKANLVIVFVYLGYYFFLRKLTFYYLNRSYLLIGLLFAVVYPLIDINELFNPQIYAAAPMAWNVNWSEPQYGAPTALNVWDMVTVLFYIVVGCFACRFLVSLYALWRIHQQSNPEKHFVYNYRRVTVNIDPFSFWRTIYVNPGLHEIADLDDIFKHETIHTRELHTIDSLIVELITICFWFNPIMWLTRLAVKENLEFIADHHVLNSGVDKKSYQYHLVNSMIKQSHSPIVNHFNMHKLKTRIMMMNKKRSSKLQLSKYFFIVPTVLVLALVFTVTKAYEEKENVTNRDLPTPQDTVKKDKQAGLVIRGKDGTVKDDILYVLDGKIIKNNEINSINPNDIESVEVLKDTSATTLYGSRGKNGVVIIKTKSKAAGSKGKTIGLEVKKDTTNKRGDIIIRDSKLKRNPLYMIDGEEVQQSEFNQLDPKTIESISILKDSAATDIYGDKGRHGVIIVKTKKKEDKITMRAESYEIPDNALKNTTLTINGKQVTQADFKKNLVDHKSDSMEFFTKANGQITIINAVNKK